MSHTVHVSCHGNFMVTNAAFLTAAAALAVSQRVHNNRLVGSDDALVLLLFTWSGNGAV